MNFSYAIFQFQYDSANPLGFDQSPDSVDLSGVFWVQGFVLNVEFELGVNEGDVPCI